MPSGLVRRPPHELAFAAAIRGGAGRGGSRTQADVAREAGLSVDTVQSAEQGTRRTSVGEAAAIAQTLGRSLDKLVKVSAAETFEPPKMGRPRRADRPQPLLPTHSEDGELIALTGEVEGRRGRPDQRRRRGQPGGRGVPGSISSSLDPPA